jgi:CBS domain-containing protein
MFETKKLMTTELIAVKRHTPLIKVVEILAENDITGLPVVNDDMTLAGVISERDVLSLLFNVDEDSIKAEDFMTKDVVSFEHDEDFIAICECLEKSNFRRVPITAEGKLVGIISRSDLIKYILEPL